MSKYEDFLNTEEVSKITGYHIDTIRRFGRTGKLKMYRSGPESNMRFKRSEVEKFITAGTPTNKIKNYSKELNQLSGKVKSREDMLRKVQKICDKYGFKLELKQESASSGTPDAK